MRVLAEPLAGRPDDLVHAVGEVDDQSRPHALFTPRSAPVVVRVGVRGADVLGEEEAVGDVLDAVAVVVDVDLVTDLLAEVPEVRPAGGLLHGDPVGDDDHVVRVVGVAERVQVRVVRDGVVGNLRRLSMARSQKRSKRALPRAAASSRGCQSLSWVSNPGNLHMSSFCSFFSTLRTAGGPRLGFRARPVISEISVPSGHELHFRSRPRPDRPDRRPGRGCARGALRPLFRAPDGPRPAHPGRHGRSGRGPAGALPLGLALRRLVRRGTGNRHRLASRRDPEPLDRPGALSPSGRARGFAASRGSRRAGTARTSRRTPPANEWERLCRSAISELPDDQRRALELAYFDGLTHQEISEKTATPLGTVKTRVRLGLMKLRDRIRPYRTGEAHGA